MRTTILAKVSQPRCAHPSRRGHGRAARLQPRCAYQIDLGGGVLAVAPGRRQRPRGVVHFLGGAFAGAAPYLTYSLLIDELADAGGYTVVTTPYALSFRHERCARGVSAAFRAALAELRADADTAWAAPSGAPLHGIGHSNGALLHLLLGSLDPLPPSTSAASLQQQQQQVPPYSSVACVSFNNRAVSDAVPLPLDPVQAAVQAVRGGETLEQAAGAAADAAVSSLLAAVQATGVAAAQPDATRALQQLRPMLTQVGSVLDQVGDGSLDFSPTPTEARAMIEARYAVARTLLVRFSDDSIDQSPEMAALLQERRGSAGVTTLTLPGNHLTPLGAAPRWRAGAAFTPADALAQAALAFTQTDVRRLAGRLVNWLDSAA